MALILADRVKVRSTTTGTGSILLASTVLGFQSFEAVGDGNETFYGIIDNQGNWEIGRGTYTAGSSTLSRDSVISSSNNNALVNFGAGGKNVFGTFPSSLAQSIAGNSVSDSFKTISVAGQTNVVADSSTDTLTLVAGSNISITTDAVTDTITVNSSSSSLENSPYTITLNASGSVSYPGNVTQSYQDNTQCLPNVDTVVYTATDSSRHAVKLFAIVEGLTDGGGLSWDTQACDIIAVKGFNNNIVHVTTYGVTYSGATAIATFDGQWNILTNRIEITCSPVSVTNDVRVSVHAIEMTTND